MCFLHSYLSLENTGNVLHHTFCCLQFHVRNGDGFYIQRQSYAAAFSILEILLSSLLATRRFATVEPDLIVTEMLAFPSKSSRNKNDSDLMIAISYM